MQSHPVPQNIAQYEFKLVGDMTLKQFMFLAIGTLLSLAVWKLPISFTIIRFFLAIIPVSLGVLAAFVPISGRPFTDWVTAFFRAIYAPTIYEYAQPKSLTIPDTPTPTQSPKTPALSFTAAITQAVGIKPAVIPNPTPPAPPPPILPTPPVAPTVSTFSPAETTTSTFIPTPPPPTKDTSTPSNLTEDRPFIPQEKPSTNPRIVPISSQDEVKVVTPNTVVSRTPLPAAPTAVNTSSILPPTSPNMLTGLVVDPNQLSISAATVEIIDSKTGIPTRALRTNRLGQFQIAIPLPIGNYTLQVEKEGFKFSPVSITVNNTIIQPILIAATSIDNTLNKVPLPETNNQVSKF